MPKSLESLNAQIAKLQKQADAIRMKDIPRIKKEIARLGLTVEDLFGTGIRSVGNGSAVEPKKAAKVKKPGADKPAKFSDDQGNTCHGIGKRPQWIHDELAAGRKLEEFLVGQKAKPAAAPKVSASADKKVTKKAAPAKKAVASKRAVLAKVVNEPAAKVAAKAPMKKAAKAAGAAKPAGKAAAKKAPAKKASKLAAALVESAVALPTA